MTSFPQTAYLTVSRGDAETQREFPLFSVSLRLGVPLDFHSLVVAFGPRRLAGTRVGPLDANLRGHDEWKRVTYS